jgi:hypothetical protein
MDIEALRDHAGEMLTVIAEDLDTPQSGHEQAETSKATKPPRPPRKRPRLRSTAPAVK